MIEKNILRGEKERSVVASKRDWIKEERDKSEQDNEEDRLIRDNPITKVNQRDKKKSNKGEEVNTGKHKKGIINSLVKKEKGIKRVENRKRSKEKQARSELD